MADTVLKLGVDSSEVRKASGDLDTLSSAGSKAEKSVGGLESVFGKLRGVIGGLGAALAARELIQTADAAALLNAKLSLVVKGTAELARAQETLFQVSQRTRASFQETANLFGSLSRATSALGLSQQQVVGVTETINKALAVSGASAQGAAAALTQLGQGFAAGALRGEELNSVLEQAPRLAQAIADGLGVPIGALKKLGEEGKLTAEAVFAALEKSGQGIAAEFEKIPLTVGGALQQAENSLLKLVGAADEVTGATGGLASVISDVAKSVGELADDIKRAGAGADDVGVLATAFQAASETVRILAANVSFVFKGVGREIGAIAAQTVALAKLDIKGFNAISEAVKADAVRARAELDAFENRVLSLDKTTKAALANQQKIEDRGFVPAPAKTGGGSSSGGKEKQSEADKYAESLRLQIQRVNELSAVEKLLEDIQSGRLGKINAKDKERLASLASQVDAAKRAKSQLEAEEKQFEDFKKSQKEAAEIAEKRFAADEQRRIAIEELGTKQVQISQQTLADLKFETEALQLTNNEREIAVALRRLEAQGVTESTEAYKQYADAIRKAVIDRNAVREAVDQAKKFEDEWKKTADQIGQSLSDALMNGGKSAAEYIKGLFRATVLQPVIQAVVGPLSGAISSAISGAKGGGGGILGSLSNITSSFTGGLASSLGGLAVKAGNLFGSTALSTLGTGMQGGTLAAGLAGPTTAGAGGLLGAGASIASAVPYIAAAVALFSAKDALFGRKLKDTGIEGTLGGSAGFSGESTKFFKGGLFRSNKTERTALDAEFADPIAQSVNAIRDGVTKYAEALNLPVDAIQSYTQALKFSTKDLTPEQVKAEIEKALSGFAEGVAATLADSVDPFSKAGETTTQTLERLGSSLTSVNPIIAELGFALFDVSAAGGDAASQLVDLFGGLEGFAKQSAGFYQNFYTEAERANAATEAITKTLGDVGLSLPATREEFRRLVEAQDLTTEGGRNSFAALLNVSDAFAQLVLAAEDATEAAKDLSAELGAAINDTITKFLTPDEQTARKFQTIAADLQAAGVEVSLEDLMGASKAQIYAFAESFVNAAENSDEAKIAVVNAAGALADLKDQADEAASALRVRLSEAIDANVDKFLSPQDQARRQASKIADSLSAVGVDFSVDRLLSATKEDIFEFAKSFVSAGENSDEAKIAVVEAAGALADLAEASAQAARDLEIADIQSQLDGIKDVFGDLSVINDPIETLSQSFVKNRDAAKSLQASLDQMIGGSTKTIQQTLGDLLAAQKALQGFRAGLQGSIEEARLRGLSPEARVASLRQTEANLFAQLPGAADPTAVAQKLQATIIARIKEEAGIRQKANDAEIIAAQLQFDLAKKARDTQIDALESQIDGYQRLQRLAQDIAQFTGSLRFSEKSPLNFEDQLSAARSLFETTLSGAQAGDENAQGNLTGNAQAFLDEARAYYGSSAAYNEIFQQVVGSLDSLGLSAADADPQIAALQSQLAQLEALNATQFELKSTYIDTSANEVAALTELDNALALVEANQAVGVEKQIELAQQQIITLTELAADNKAQLAQQAAISQGLNDRLDELNGNVSRLVQNSNETVNAP